MAALWRAVREPVVALLLMPFVLLALMGPGTMLARGPDGGFAIVLCTPEGPAGHTPADAAPGPCAWSLAVGQAALVAPPPVVPVLALSETQLRRSFDTARHQRSHALHAPSARGPPRSV